MAIASVTEAAFEPKSVSLGPVKFQIVELVINSGATSGTVQATRLKEIYHIIIPGIKSHTAAPTYSGNTATLAFTVPAETAASQTYDTSITVTAAANLGAAGNSVTLTVVDDAAVTQGNEVVTVSGTDVTVKIDLGNTTRTQVRQAINASTSAAALMSATGTSATAAAEQTATPLSGGVSGGFRGTALCIGR